jgi:hypothetical protein
MAVLVFFVVFCGYKSVNSHTGGAMTKPVAVFLSGVISIGDSRHTVRLDENSHLVLFSSFSRYITSWAISATWPVEASVGVNPGFSLRYTMHLVLLVPQHQTAMYETYN